MAHITSISLIQFFISTNFFIVTVICNGRSDLLTDREIHEIFKTHRDSAPNYGIIEIESPRIRSKRSWTEAWQLPVTFSNGSVIILNLYEASGILANKYTPIWLAEHDETDARGVLYSRYPQDIEKRVGKFRFYQDYVNRAAIVLFHKGNIIEGFVEHYELEQITPESSPNPRGEFPIRYVLRESTKLNETSAAERSQRKLYPERLRPDEFPKIVFPELLIVLDRDYVRKGIANALRKVLAFFNAVDMLFSAVRLPQIKLNIAGIIIPMDSKTTPWTNKKYRLGRMILNITSSVGKIADHFLQYQDEFPPDSYDFIITFTSDELIDAEGFLVLGAAFLDVPCDDLEHRIAAINYIRSNHVTCAHELGHLFSGSHGGEDGCNHNDGIMSEAGHRYYANLFWSSCTLRSFETYFWKKKSMCLDNCPATVKSCPAPGNICAESFTSFCEKMKFTGPSGPVSCNHYASCKLLNQNIFKIHTPTLPPDGTICEYKSDTPTKICYKQRCVPYEPFKNLCPRSEENIMRI